MTWNNLGFAYFGLREYERALQCYNNSTVIDPNNILALNHKGEALAALGRHAEAEVAFAKAKELEVGRVPIATGNK
jgi:tetratricopeptide (TPR) repeat protein